MLLSLACRGSWMNARQQMTKKQANKRGMGYFCGTPVHTVKNTTILDQLPCLQTHVNAVTLMYSNRKCAMERKRRKYEGCGSSSWEDFFNEGLCSVLLWSIVGVHCTSAFCHYTNFKEPYTLYDLVQTCYVYFFFYILDSSGFSAPESRFVSCQCF